MEIRIDNLEGPEVLTLLREHLNSLAPTAPAESRHALDLRRLRGPDITFWSIWDGPVLAGFGALKHLSGSMDFLEPARRLYASFGFVPGLPFGNYKPDPNSVFMTRQITELADGKVQIKDLMKSWLVGE